MALPLRTTVALALGLAVHAAAAATPGASAPAAPPAATGHATMGPHTAACGLVQPRHFRTSDGVRLRYLEGGDAGGVGARTLVFVPGWTMPAEIWQDQLAHFAARFRVVALDPRSQGGSEIAPGGHTARRRGKDIDELIDRLGGGPVVLVAWSLAVLEALAMVSEVGDARLAALVLVDNSVGEDPPPVPRPPRPRRPASERPAEMATFVRGMFRTPQDPGFLESLTRTALRTPAPVADALLRYAEPRTFWKDALYTVRKPVLYAVTPRFQGQADNVARRHPSATVELFPGAGHALFVDEAARFNTLLERFVCGSVDCLAPADVACPTSAERRR